jgi:hypothetical protein
MFTTNHLVCQSHESVTDVHRQRERANKEEMTLLGGVGGVTYRVLCWQVLSGGAKDEGMHDINVTTPWRTCFAQL